MIATGCLYALFKGVCIAIAVMALAALVAAIFVPKGKYTPPRIDEDDYYK